MSLIMITTGSSWISSGSGSWGWTSAWPVLVSITNVYDSSPGPNDCKKIVLHGKVFTRDITLIIERRTHEEDQKRLLTTVFWRSSLSTISIPTTPIRDYSEKRYEIYEIIFLVRLSDWQTDWQTDCLNDWLTDWLTGGLNDWLTDWLTNEQNDGLMDWLTDWLTGWLAGWLAGWLTDWLTDWLASWLSVWQTDWLTEWVTGTNEQAMIDKMGLSFNKK